MVLLLSLADFGLVKLIVRCREAIYPSDFYFVLPVGCVCGFFHKHLSEQIVLCSPFICPP